MRLRLDASAVDGLRATIGRCSYSGTSLISLTTADGLDDETIRQEMGLVIDHQKARADSQPSFKTREMVTLREGEPVICRGMEVRLERDTTVSFDLASDKVRSALRGADDPAQDQRVAAQPAASAPAPVGSVREVFERFARAESSSRFDALLRAARAAKATDPTGMQEAAADLTALKWRKDLLDRLAEQLKIGPLPVID